mgnify:CR=1 FL=1
MVNINPSFKNNDLQKIQIFIKNISLEYYDDIYDMILPLLVKKLSYFFWDFATFSHIYVLLSTSWFSGFI